MSLTVRLENVTKCYPYHGGQRAVLQNLNLEIASGEKVGILGRNGAGKSTLIRLIGGVEMPTSGRVFRGIRVSWPLAFNGGYQGTLTGVDNTRLICRIYEADYERVIAFVRDFSELGGYLREPIKTYSSGMVARLSFALSLAIEFDCYLIDEVTSVGDSRFQDRCREELFGKRGDRAMIMVSHQIDMIREHCSRAYVLNDGTLHKFDDLDSAYAYYDASQSSLI